MVKRKPKVFPYPVVPGTESTDRPSGFRPVYYPQNDVSYRAPPAAEDYKKLKRAKDFWEGEGVTSKHSDKYLDNTGRFINTRLVRRYKDTAVRRAQNLDDPSTHSRFWAPEENIDDVFRRQKGKKKKPVRKRRKLAKKKLSGKNRKKSKKRARQHSNT